ncbi:MAG: VOC family protein [Myxococcales bacterium]|nr:VOC family protein [Myxococcota bacterium]MDW8282463.1 VOC family protein [Myxococcales bacterium]
MVGTDNPLGLLGVDAIHFFVGNLTRARRFYEGRIGFREVARATLDLTRRAEMESIVLAAGAAHFFISAPLTGTSRAGRYLRRHPDGVAEILLRVADLDRAFEVLRQRDATFITERTDVRTALGAARWFTIATPLGDVDLTFLERPDGPFCPPGFEVSGEAPAHNLIGITGIDHITSNLRTMRPWVDFLRQMLDCEEYWRVQFHTNDLRPGHEGGSGLRSIVMWHAASGIKFANNEPLMPHFRRSQISIFCDDNRGAGVQHVALAVPDLCRAVEELRGRGVAFLSTPATYYDAVPTRLQAAGCPPLREPLDRLRDLGILIDGNQEGYLLQIFVKEGALLYEDPSAGPFFLELIQRAGNRGFGEGNFRALFEAIERQQAGAAGRSFGTPAPNPQESAT